MNIFLLLCILSTKNIQPFTAEFTKKTFIEGREEIVKGIIFYIAPWRVYYQINYPINQMISIVKNTTTIYYPDEKKAFRIISNNPYMLPIDQHFITQERQDELTKKLGLKQEKMAFKSDTVFISLIPVNKRNILSKIVFGKIDDKIVYTEIVMKNNKSRMKIHLDKHFLIGSSYIPTEVISKRWVNSYYIEEQINYSKVSACPSITDSLTKFQVPKGIEIKEINW